MIPRPWLPALLLLAGGNGPAFAEEAAPEPAIAVARCSIFVGTDPARGIDCTAEANRQCGGKALCEIGIGRTLSAGRDQPEDAQVRFVYGCGTRSGEAGPHPFNDHATVTLACAFTD